MAGGLTLRRRIVEAALRLSLLLLTALAAGLSYHCTAQASTGILQSESPQSVQRLPRSGIEQASFDEMLYSTAPQDGWRVFEWASFPGIFVIHFDTYLLQGQSFNRVAMFVEKAGQRGKVPTETELRASVEGQGLSTENIYAAHDYRTSDLARFFNSAAESGIVLFPQEQSILDWLLDSGLLIFDSTRGGYRAAGREAVLSFATRYLGTEGTASILGQPDRAWEARALYHETRHGLYFTRPLYRQRCVDFWYEELSAGERRALRLALAVFHYDPTDEELMINEWMAYLLTPDYYSIGSQIFPQRLRAMAAGQLRPPGFDNADAVLLERIGPALAARVELSMVSELRKWIGSEWDVPRFDAVARIGKPAD